MGRIFSNRWRLNVDDGGDDGGAGGPQVLDRLVEQVRETEPIDEDQPVLVAGDKELACRETRLEQGIPLSHQVADELDGLLDRFELNQVPRLLSGS